MNTLLIISPITAMLLTHILIHVFRKIALQIQLVDKPNYRKVHNKPIPLIGGISIFTATILSLALSVPLDSNVSGYKTIFIAALILVVMGVIDDRFDLRASLKLGIQLILAHFMYAQGIRIESLHGLFGFWELPSGFQYIITIAVIAGVVNAFNLMDGIDGLAAGIAIMGFLVLTILSIITNQTMMTLVFLTSLGSLLTFFKFNISKGQKIFMGDAGSTLLGFILAISGISLIQAANNSAHLYVVIIGVIAILFVPVLDALRVFRKRVKSGKSPFHADKTHIHHLILNQGYRHLKTTLVILIFSALIMIVSYVIFYFVGLTFSILSMFIVFYVVTKVLYFNNTLKHWKDRITIIEVFPFD